MVRRTWCALAVSLGMLLPAAWAQPTEEAPRFAEPARLMAGEKHLGEKRLYPSPVWYDVDGDSVLDVLVADLRGWVTVARGLPGSEEGLRYGPEERLKDRQGEFIDFQNW